MSNVTDKSKTLSTYNLACMNMRLCMALATIISILKWWHFRSTTASRRHHFDAIVANHRFLWIGLLIHSILKVNDFLGSWVLPWWKFKADYAFIQHMIYQAMIAAPAAVIMLPWGAIISRGTGRVYSSVLIESQNYYEQVISANIIF